MRTIQPTLARRGHRLQSHSDAAVLDSYCTVLANRDMSRARPVLESLLRVLLPPSYYPARTVLKKFPSMVRQPVRILIRWVLGVRRLAGTG